MYVVVVVTMVHLQMMTELGVNVSKHSTGAAEFLHLCFNIIIGLRERSDSGSQWTPLERPSLVRFALMTLCVPCPVDRWPPGVCTTSPAVLGQCTRSELSLYHVCGRYGPGACLQDMNTASYCPCICSLSLWYDNSFFSHDVSKMKRQ